MIDLADRSTQEALLGRRVLRVLRATDHRRLRDQRVLITGAGGTIGSALATQIATCEPACLTLFDHSEYNLFQVLRALRATAPSLRVEPVLGDVSKAWSIGHACRLGRPDVVYHAAAYKHVTMTEGAVCAAIECNVIGTVTTLAAAADARARFVLISSDKAAAPTSVMGATKRLAELATVSRAGTAFRPIVVRFGNVLGSSGSVVELMLEQIAGDRAIEITHLDATRFFMTAAEAAALVVKADLLGQSGVTYWLDVGRPVKIADLAMRAMVLANHRVPIEVIGLRPGEKLTEELHDQGLELARTAHPRIHAARQPRFDADAIGRTVRSLRHDVAVGDGRAALEALVAAVPGFDPSASAIAAAASTSVGHALGPVEAIPMHRSA